MALSQRLEFRQTQSLVMTPQLMQAIKLLQLSNLDLAAFVEDEIEKNPLLDRANENGEPPVLGEASERGEYSDDGGSDGGSDSAEFGERGSGDTVSRQMNLSPAVFVGIAKQSA